MTFTHWQLFLTGFGTSNELQATTAAQPSAVRSAGQPVTWQIPGQLALFSCRRDFTRFDRRAHANPDNRTLIHARMAARDLGEARGWSHHLADEVDDALVVLLSAHAPGDRLSYTEIGHVDRLGYNVSRTAEVIDHLGLLDDDRADTVDAWLAGRLTVLTPGIAEDVEAWFNTLRHGGTRTTPRAVGTVRDYLAAAMPALITWSARYAHLRQVTRDDVREHLDGMTGLPRKRHLVGLRSLFRWCKNAGRIFRDPTTHFSAGNVGHRLPMPLPADTLTRAVQACTTPAHRLALALAAIHAARPIAVRRLKLEDIDRSHRRITINGHTRPLDDLTAELLDRHLVARQRRWPHTLNQHLFLSEQTGHDLRSVSEGWLEKPLRGLGVTFKQISMDRQLEEALSHGPDALHLAVLFGIGDRTAMRYADAARRLLTDHPAAGAASSTAGTPTLEGSTSSSPR
ncbi:integrase [Micromonospora sp. CPCC 205546]|uniref:integrase n=1 Tax=Micromonospora sp. CPCC 205546 TaxID=3122397 RepID=UPI002FF277FF